MKPHWRIILISICLMVALGAAPAHADRYRGHGSSHNHGQHYGYRGYGYRGSYGWSYAPSYWGGYRYGPAYYGPGYGSLGIGYAWGGHHDSYGVSLSLPLYFGPRYNTYPATAYPAPATYRTIRYVEAQPAVRAAPAPACRQTREYTTQITIGDQVLPAYGTACLQADGSWKIISGPILADE